MKKISKEKEGLTSKTAKGFFWLSSGKIIQSFIQIAVLAVLARLITPESFGIAQASFIVVGFANLLSQMGVGPALVQKKEINDTHLRVGFTFSLFMGLILAALNYTFSDYIASFFEMNELSKVIKVISLIFIIESFVVVSESMLQKKMKFKQYALVNITSYIIGYAVIGVIYADFDYGYWALIYAFIGQVVVKAICVSILEPHSYKFSFKQKELRELLYFGGGFTIAKFANYFAGQGDNIIVGKFLGASTLGLYSRAYSIMVQPVNLIGTALDKVLFPAMASVQDDRTRLKKAFLNGVSAIAIISMPLSILIIIVSPEIVMILLGADWTDAVIPLQILSAALLFRMGYKISDSLARATGNVYKRAWRQYVYAFAIISGTYLGKEWGLEGVAFSVVLAVGLNYFLMAHLSLKIIDLKWIDFLKSHKNGLLNMILCGILTYSFTIVIRSISVSDLLNLTLIVSINSLSFLLLITKWPNIFLGKENFIIKESMQKYLKVKFYD